MDESRVSSASRLPRSALQRAISPHACVALPMAIQVLVGVFSACSGQTENPSCSPSCAAGQRCCNLPQPVSTLADGGHLFGHVVPTQCLVLTREKLEGIDAYAFGDG